MAIGTDTLEVSLQQQIMELVTASGTDKTVCPTTVAQAYRSENWRSLMKPIRRAAIALAKDGRIAIFRKGKPVPPDQVKGVIRLGLPPA